MLRKQLIARCRQLLIGFPVGPGDFPPGWPSITERSLKGIVRIIVKVPEPGGTLVRVNFEEHEDNHASNRNVKPDGECDPCDTSVHGKPAAE